MTLKLIVNEYVGCFYKRDKLGRWRKFQAIGNSGVALVIASMLRRLGYTVLVEEETLGAL